MEERRFSILQKYCFILITIVESTILFLPINHATVMSESSSFSNTSMEHTCLIQTINKYGNKSVIVQDSPQHPCSWQVSMLHGVSSLLQFLDKENSTSNQVDFLYIEQAGDVKPCESKYVSVDIHSYPCSVGFRGKNLTVYLQGDLFISISETSTDIVPSGLPNECSDIQMEKVTLKPNVTSNNCYTMKGYDSIITCASPNTSITASQQSTDCSLHFPSHCNATLGNREVFLECSSNEDLLNNNFLPHGSVHAYTALLIYPIRSISMNLSGNNIYKIEVGILQELTNLQQLYLENNHLEEIDAHLFENLATLIILDIASNHLKILKSRIFSDLCNLVELKLSNNQIYHLEIGIFQNLINLQVLQLAFNKLTALNQGIFAHLTHLQELDLSHNLLSDLSHQEIFAHLTNLQKLVLSDNLLSNLSHLLFVNFNNLRELDLRHNQLSTLQGSPFKYLNKLESLTARGNHLNSLGPSVLKGLHSLIQLFLNLNQLETLPTSLFQKVPRLEVIFLQGNKLTTLASDIFLGLHNLTYLILGHNRLTEMGDNIFKETTNLIFLDLQTNKLSKLPNLQYLKKLAYLGLKNNTLTKLKDKFPSFAKTAHMIVSQPEICKCYTTSNTSCTSLSEQSPYLTCKRLLSNRVLCRSLCGSLV